MNRPQILTLTAFASCFASARAESLNLTLLSPIDVTALPHTSIGDLTTDRSTNRLAFSDGGFAGEIYVLNTVTEALITTIDPSVIPGLGSGPDAIAFRPDLGVTDDLYVFSSFGESEGGRITFGGALVSDYGTSNGATGADVDAAGNLWIASGTVLGGGSTLRRINTSTGAVLQSVPILGVTQRCTDIAFDPFSGALYCLGEDGLLREVNTTTGATVSTTDLTPFLPSLSLVGGLAFEINGVYLYVGMGTGVAADQIVRLRRDVATTICDSSDTLHPCPCSNPGLPGHGCENSFSTGGGVLVTTGLADVSSDTLVLRVSLLPPSTSVLFFQGTTTPEPGPPPFGDGLRCVVGTVIRIGTHTTSGGISQYPLAGEPDVSVRGLVPVGGATRFYQAWYCNSATFCTPSGFNLTNGIRLPWRA